MPYIIITASQILVWPSQIVTCEDGLHTIEFCPGKLLLLLLLLKLLLLVVLVVMVVVLILTRASNGCKRRGER